MPVIICTKFEINQVIVTLFSGVWDKNATPVVEITDIDQLSISECYDLTCPSNANNKSFP